MISIIGGDWSGRKLTVPDRDSLRPTAGRVKAAIFSIIESYRLKQGLSARLEDCRVLDLFAGIGGLGFEALSRGAAHCTFVEKDRAHVTALRKNMGILECEKQVTIVPQAVEHHKYWQSHGPFDLVFLDPPYALPHLPTLLATTQLEDVLSPSAIIVFEHGPKDKIMLTPKLVLHSERKLGPAGLSVFQYPA